LVVSTSKAILSALDYAFSFSFSLFLSLLVILALLEPVYAWCSFRTCMHRRSQRRRPLIPFDLEIEATA